jgi:phage-related baseplate assembly protein
LIIAIRADEAGSASSAGAGLITRLVSGILGVSCSNDNALVGLDTEADDSLIARCMLKPLSLSPNGPRGAFEYFARMATRSDGTLVGVNRVNVANSSPTGQAVVTVATASGQLSPSDLEHVRSSIENNALPECVTLTLTTSTDVLVNIEFWAYFDEFELSPEEQDSYVTPVLQQWFASTRIGGSTILGVGKNKIFRDTIRHVIASAFPVKPALVVLHSPTVDVTLTASQTAEPGAVIARAA